MALTKHDLPSPRALVTALIDLVRPIRDLTQTANPRQAEHRGGHVTAAAFALNALRRLGLRVGCKRRAFALSRAYARDGCIAHVCFGIGPNGSVREQGHAWIELEGRTSTQRAAYAAVVRPGQPADASGWRRG